MMTDVFNTEFELFLRILLILNSPSVRKVSSDRIAAIDFITVYGKDFGVSDQNLHGDNNYRFSEISCRRDLITKAIKALVIDGMAKVICQKSGFYYSISDNGKNYCSKFNNTYADTYSSIVKHTLIYIDNKSDRELANQINSYSIIALQGGLINE
ncbi:ABC-three component system middle component 2 [Desulfosporosinus sp. I2]|uniref:ABC-three component system middle component 2 n=1 Tax=Desulfosporosinus sp. I2 TaxID=1617025 RepID=UPI000B05242D|nr:ABC-three component system middle component 2 [Desulfosporosinus sp. I2]